MIKEFNKNRVLIKLVYYCNKNKEVYFKRSQVTSFIMDNNVFKIPNKQGFDGNLSYFGWDINNDSDNQRILLLRGNRLNEACLDGNIGFEILDDTVRIDSSEDVFNEIDNLILNKTKEAGMFRLRDRRKVLTNARLNAGH